MWPNIQLTISKHQMAASASIYPALLLMPSWLASQENYFPFCHGRVTAVVPLTWSEFAIYKVRDKTSPLPRGGLFRKFQEFVSISMTFGSNTNSSIHLFLLLSKWTRLPAREVPCHCETKAAFPPPFLPRFWNHTNVKVIQEQLTSHLCPGKRKSNHVSFK